MTLKVTLITGLTINPGANVKNKTSSEYQEATAYCELNSKDIGILGKVGRKVKVKTKHVRRAQRMRGGKITFFGNTLDFMGEHNINCES